MSAESDEERAMRALDKGQRFLADELRSLLSAFLDREALPGWAITQKKWDRACFLCGRDGPPWDEHEVPR